jgi:hypothetical protein
MIRTIGVRTLYFLMFIAASGSLAHGQELPVIPPVFAPTTCVPDAVQPGICNLCDLNRGNPGFLAGTRDFPNFIGFISNPTQSIDPRANTEIYPIFGSGWVSGNGPLLANGNGQVYGAGMTVALSDRFSMGLNQGGYAVVELGSDRQRLLAKLGLPIPDRDIGGQREGWMNLGGFFQYTLIADVPRQFLLTAGVRWEAPSGAEQVFQGGANPAYLAPYLTAGKEFGFWHVLATTGYEFPTGSGQTTTNTAYLNFHIDRQIGWFYPLVEFNGSYHTSTVDLNLPARHEVIDLGGFTSAGNMLSISVGANAVLVPGKLEFGAVYSRPIVAQDRFDVNGLLVKMVYRY